MSAAVSNAAAAGLGSGFRLIESLGVRFIQGLGFSAVSAAVINVFS